MSIPWIRSDIVYLVCNDFLWTTCLILSLAVCIGWTVKKRHVAASSLLISTQRKREKPAAESQTFQIQTGAAKWFGGTETLRSCIWIIYWWDVCQTLPIYVMSQTNHLASCKVNQQMHLANPPKCTVDHETALTKRDLGCNYLSEWTHMWCLSSLLAVVWGTVTFAPE